MTELVLRRRVVRPLLVGEVKEPNEIPWPWLMRDAFNQNDTPIKGNLLTHEEPIKFTYDAIKS